MEAVFEPSIPAFALLTSALVDYLVLLACGPFLISGSENG
jgi:hypothetical protein